jgi:hypothetical protein
MPHAWGSWRRLAEEDGAEAKSYLVHAAMLSAIARNQSKEALSVWQKYRDQLVNATTPVTLDTAAGIGRADGGAAGAEPHPERVSAVDRRSGELPGALVDHGVISA